MARQTFPAALVPGAVLKISGYITTDRVSEGSVNLWGRADSQRRPDLAYQDLGTRAPHGDTSWQRFEIALPVAANADTVTLGITFKGAGTARIDDLNRVGTQLPRSIPPRGPCAHDGCQA